LALLLLFLSTAIVDEVVVVVVVEVEGLVLREEERLPYVLEELVVL